VVMGHPSDTLSQSVGENSKSDRKKKEGELPSQKRVRNRHKFIRGKQTTDKREGGMTPKITSGEAGGEKETTIHWFSKRKAC